MSVPATVERLALLGYRAALAAEEPDGPRAETPGVVALAARRPRRGPSSRGVRSAATAAGRDRGHRAGRGGELTGHELDALIAGDPGPETGPDNLSRPAVLRAVAPLRDGVPQTLDDLLVGVWEDLSSRQTTSCPVCRGAMTPRQAAGRGSVVGRCSSCGTSVS